MIDIPISSNWFYERTQLNGDNTALVTGEGELSFQELSEKVKMRSLELVSIGVNKNNIIGILAEHTQQFIIDMLAVWNIGAIVLPMNIKLSQNEINEQANYLGCRILNKPNPAHFPTSNYFKYSNYNTDETALIMFTSGSTGQHKAVEHSFRSLFASVSSIDKTIDFRSGEKWLASLPFYRIGGFQIIVRALLSGGILHLPNSVSSAEIDKSITKYSPTYVSLVNASLKEVIGNSNLKSAKAIFVGGGQIDSKLFLQGIEEDIPIYKVYGSTETGSMVTILSSKEMKSKIESTGKPLEGVEIKTDQNEILVKTESLFKGYYRNQEFTTEKLTNGWFHTGDQGFIDDDGFLFVEGRIDNLITSGGEKINPEEIENELLKIQGVEEAKVFGIPDDKWGEKICAALVSKRKLNIEQISESLRQNLPSFKLPKVIKQIEAYPLDAMGKINFKELNELFN